MESTKKVNHAIHNNWTVDSLDNSCNNLRKEIEMKTGDHYIRQTKAMPIKCPVCRGLLCISERSVICATFKIDSYQKSDKGHCSNCKEWFLVPDLTNIYNMAHPKVVDAGLFQEMLDALRFVKGKASPYVMSGGILHDILAKVAPLVSKAEKA